jgi:E3 ubiquitin-protein ligase ATL41
MSTSESDNDYTHGDNRKTILVSIFSLFALVILFINLHIYSRYCLRRQASLHRETTNDQVAPDDQIHSIEEPMIGLDPLVVASLPKFIYKPSTYWPVWSC